MERSSIPTETPMTKTPMAKTPNRSIRIAGAVALALTLGASLLGCSSDTKADAKKVKAKVKVNTTATSPASTTIATASTPSGATGATDRGQTGGGQPGGGGSTAPVPTINSFDTPENIDCHNGNLQEFTVSWSTANAANVTISIDGPGIYNTYPTNGSTILPFNCSSAHTLLLTAFGQDGKTTTKTVTLEPRNVQTTTPDPEDQS